MLYSNIMTQKVSTDVEVMEQYIHDIANGDKDALGKLYEDTCSAIYGFALSIVKEASDAEDVLQDVYIKVFGAASTYQSKGKPLAWLLTITKNLARMRLREKKRSTLLPTDEILYENQETVTDEDRMVLDALLRELKDMERQIVVLHSLTGLKHREIATLLNIPLPTVLSKYNRAIKKLRNHLAEEENYGR